VRQIHAVIGWSIVIGFGLMTLWGLVTWIVRRGPGRPYWWILTYVQVAVLVQAVAGVILLALGGSVPLLHYVYGVIFPVLVLAVAHVLAREMFSNRPWAAFALAAFFCFGLTARALQTGLGLA
jgi:hypothetical protein